MRQGLPVVPRARRLFDVIGAVGGLLAFSPAMAVIAAAIYLDDGGPILFRQVRLGLARQPFTIVKFRTMSGGRVTRAGRVLRATGLDELPQFINILRGNMSAVGPRPLADADVRRLGWTITRFDFRWRVLPGLTGLAQVMGRLPASLSEPGSVVCRALESAARRQAGCPFICHQRAGQNANTALPGADADENEKGPPATRWRASGVDRECD